MRIIIKATNVKLSEDLKDWVELKLRPLERLEQSLATIDVLPAKEDERIDLFVEIGKTTRRHQKGDVFRAEAQMRLLGQSIRAQAVADDLREAVNDVKEKLERQIVEYKEKARMQD